MKKNMGLADRLVRTLLAVAFIALYFSGAVAGVTGIILLVLAFVFLATSLVAFCPLYRLAGLSTCRVEHASR